MSDNVFDLGTLRDFFAKEEISSTNASQGLTASVYSPSGKKSAEYALVTVEDADIRFWPTGDAPSVSSGHYADAGAIIKLAGANQVRNFKFISAVADDHAALKVSYGK